MALLPIRDRVPEHIKVFQNRAQYRAIMGVDAPPFDYSFPVKPWLDTRKLADPEAEIRYVGMKLDSNSKTVFDANGVGLMAQFTLFANEAQSVNLPPEPLPPQSVLTPWQLKNVQRVRSIPIELKPGERVVITPGDYINPSIDDGINTPKGPSAGGGFTEADRLKLDAIYALLVK